MFPNKLYYFGTDVEVKKGDHIIYRTLFRQRKLKGRVTYIPEKTARERAQQKEDSEDWLIELEDKTITGWLYSPEDLQPTKRITFISRGNDNKGMTHQELEEMEEKIALEEGPGLEMAGLIVVIIILVLFLAFYFLILP